METGSFLSTTCLARRLPPGNLANLIEFQVFIGG
jgi:hypothetical protein